MCRGKPRLLRFSRLSGQTKHGQNSRDEVTRTLRFVALTFAFLAAPLLSLTVNLRLTNALFLPSAFSFNS